MKEKYNKHMENLRKKNQKEIKSPINQIKNIVERHSSILEQVEERILGLNDKTQIKEKQKNF
jgi:hypothetical protein